MVAVDGAWDPWSIDEVMRVFDGAPFRWWITGGMALELHVGRSWRDHADLDVGICRSDAADVWRWLDDRGATDAHLASRGRLSEWTGRPLSEADDENNIWLSLRSDERFCLDLAIGSGSDEHWIYRRDPAITRRWPEAVLHNETGVPYLAPDLQLLFKSKRPRTKDDEDLDVVVPLLTDAQRSFLVAQLRSDHAWQSHLRTGTT